MVSYNKKGSLETRANWISPSKLSNIEGATTNQVMQATLETTNYVVLCIHLGYNINGKWKASKSAFLQSIHITHLQWTFLWNIQLVPFSIWQNNDDTSQFIRSQPLCWWWICGLIWFWLWLEYKFTDYKCITHYSLLDLNLSCMIC